MKYLLIIRLIWPATAYDTVIAKFDTVGACIESLNTAEIKIPEHNAENEWAGFKVCVPEADLKLSWEKK